jgi:hypothetical protein
MKLAAPPFAELAFERLNRVARIARLFGQAMQRALYAKYANAASRAAFHQVLSFERGDVVQLVRTLPCHGMP